MKWYSDMKIGSKLISGFVFVAVIAGLIGVVGVSSIKALNNSDTALYEKMTVPVSIVGDISTNFQQMRVSIRDSVLAGNPSDIQANTAKINDKLAAIKKLSADFEKTIGADAEMRTAYQAFVTAHGAYQDQLTKFLELVNANKDAEALAAMAPTTPFGQTLKVEQDALAKIVSIKIAEAKTTAESNSKQANQTSMAMIALAIAGVAIAIGLGLYISRMISRPLIAASEMMHEMSQGNLGMRLKMTTKDEIGDMARAMDDFADDLKENVVGVMESISNGDVSMTVESKGTQDEISPAMIRTIETIRGLVSEMGRLIQSVQEGRLDARGDSAGYMGSWQEMILGINNLVEAFVKPFGVTAHYVDSISKGEIPPMITDTYQGDFNEIKNNLNSCVQTMNNLIRETNILTEAAIEGHLSARADESGFSGAWAELIQGINHVLGAVVEPIKEASDTLSEMAQGNLQVRMLGSYKGDHAQIKDALNGTLDALSGYVYELSSTLNEISQSNLDVEIQEEYLGDFAQIKDAVNSIAQSMNSVLGEMGNAAEQVAGGSRQVSDGSQALSQGATEQASAIEELTASITQIAAQTKQNAVSASQANGLSINAKVSAEQGNESMKSMLKSMRDINDSAASISKIIKVIDEIAFQTNILALNAAVEAARAGQHGKGFAVVAEEVRNLAARSANAAKETAALIEDSIAKVGDGTRIANETAVSLNGIVEGVSKATVLVGEIAEASNEQATAIAQINKGIEQVSIVVQTNSATSEESAAASEELSGQAEMLQEMVGKFRLRQVNSNRSSSRMESRVIQDATKGRQKGRRVREMASESMSVPKINLNDMEYGKY